MMFSIKNTVVLIIDVQGNLAQRMYRKQELFQNITTLIQAAKILHVPVLWTEQVPDKIGPTIPKIAKLLSGQKPFVKASFSCCGNKKFLKKLASTKRKHVIIAGIEAHVCVYQTVVDLISRRYHVQVVADAVSSRSSADKIVALDHIKTCKGDITTTEMIICELLKTTQHRSFRHILKLIK